MTTLITTEAAFFACTLREKVEHPQFELRSKVSTFLYGINRFLAKNEAKRQRKQQREQAALDALRGGKRVDESDGSSSEEESESSQD